MILWRIATLVPLALAALLAGCGEGPRPIAAAQAQVPPPARGPAAVARGRVEVQGGLLELMAPAEGTVERVGVAEGEAVRQGQLLLTLAAGPARQDLAVAQAELALAQARQRARVRRVQPAREALQRLDEAARAGAVEPQRSDEARQALRDAESAVEVAAAEVQLARARLGQSQSQLERLAIRSPQDGTVVALHVQPGTRAAAQGRPLLVLLPSRPLLVRAELNESFVAAVKPGMRAAVVPEGGLGDGGSGPLAGKVLRVGALYGSTRLEDDNSLRANQRVVECWIALDQASSLRAGQYVRVEFHE